MKVVLAVLLVLCLVSSVHAGWWSWNGSVSTDPTNVANWTSDGTTGAWTNSPPTWPGYPAWHDGLTISQTGGVRGSPLIQMPVMSSGGMWMTYPLQVLSGGSFTLSGSAYLTENGWYMDIESGGTITVTGNAQWVASAPYMYAGGTLIVSSNAEVDFTGFSGANLPGTFDLSGNAKLVLTGDYIGSPLLNSIQCSINPLDGLGTESAVFDGTNTIVTSVPEPVTILLLGIGSVALIRRRK